MAEFSITAWSACAASLATPDAWLAWARAPWLPLGEDDKPPLAQMPALLRRRLSGVGRQAAQAAYQSEPAVVPGTPVVFASRYGDAVRSIDLLRGFAASGEVSPTDFALSVHNAIGAIYSIARRDEANYVSVAGGAASAASALIEAAALLADGARAVTVVCYDAALPPPYALFHSEPAASYAWAWRVCRPMPGEPRFELRLSSADETAPDGADGAGALLPFGLDVLRFVLSQETRLQRQADGLSWTWTRHV